MSSDFLTGSPAMVESILKPKTWRILDSPDCDNNELLPVSPIMQKILINRGILTRCDAEKFLNPSFEDLHDPFLMDGMETAVKRTLLALERKEKILIHGDYDVDGVTATTLMVRVLRILGADVIWHVPHRKHDGYGLAIQTIETAKENDVKLIITVDCGITAVEEVEFAKSFGIDVIITDHHEPGETLPAAISALNPIKPGCGYPFKALAGVGVAFKFAEALVKDCGYDTKAFRKKFCDLAAIGTVADIVPLVGENRILVKFGLEEIPRSGKKGIQALLKLMGANNRPITSQTLAYYFAPRLNAAGRLDDASLAVDLLLTKDDDEAAKLAQTLDQHNKERQSQQERITKEAFSQIDAIGLDENRPVIVLSSQDWHPGIVGIVASKITEKYSRPAILVAVDETSEMGVGSARSVGKFDIHGALLECVHLLARCGGHSKAAGLSISLDNISEFDSAINSFACKILKQDDLLPELEIDAEIELDNINYNLAHELSLLEPFGSGNPEPIFKSEGALLIQKTVMGSNNSHLRLKLASASGMPLECVAFGWGKRETAFRVGSIVDLCYNIQINCFNGRETVQAVLRDARNSSSKITEPSFPENRMV